MLATATQYHHITSYNRYEMKGHGLDWANRPAIYKQYRGAEYFTLPRSGNLPRVPLQHLTNPSRQKAAGKTALTIDRLSVVLALAYGITGHVRTGGENFYYRSAPSAGALYPVEIYMAVQNVDGLLPGLYHYDVSEHRLCLLRPENITSFADACIETNEGEPAPHVCFFFSAVIFRSAWKYKARAFRYLLLDTGHVLENLFMALMAEELPAIIHYDIHRDRANQLLGLDPKREICLACARIPGNNPIESAVFKELAGLPRDIINAGRTASKEVVYREIEYMALAPPERPVHTDPPADMMNHLGISPGDWQQIERPHLSFAYDFSDAVMSRRSRRNFIPEALSGDVFFELLSFLSRSFGTGQPRPYPAGSVISTGLLVQNVKNISSGFYLCDFSNNRWSHVRPGRLNGDMAVACLDQQWLRNAALHFCFLANLDQLDRNRGAGGYRYAMFEAGRLGQRIYLAAAALGLGCCGIGALYDNEARTLLGLNKSSVLLYLVAAGPVKR